MALAFERYADLMLTIKNEALASQEGITADDARVAFDQGISSARQIAELNRAKGDSYAAVHRAVAEFRSSLRELALQGNEAINSINQSRVPLQTKVSEITAVIAEIRAQATTQLASCSDDIRSATYAVLASQGIDQSPQLFASGQGTVATVGGGAPTDLEAQIQEVLRQTEGTIGSTTPSGLNAPSLGDQGALPPTTSNASPATTPGPGQVKRGEQLNSVATSSERDPALVSTIPDQGVQVAKPLAAASSTPPPTAVVPDQGATKPALSTQPSPVLAQGLEANATSTTSLNPAGPTSSPPSAVTVRPTIDATAPRIDGPISPAVRTDIGPESAHVAPALSPEHLAENLNTGNHAGAPVASGAEAIATAAAGPVHSAPPPLSTPLPEAGVPAPHAFETTHASAAGADFTQIASTPTEATPPLAAAPTPAVAPSFAPSPLNAAPVTTAAPAPPSALMAYGADLRPPVVTPAVTTPITPSTSPVSAPLNASAGSAPTGQPAVVRQQPLTPPAHTPAAAGLTERAVAATASGAAAGAAAADAAAKTRLQRLLQAVARQQPQLAWAIGDLDDGSTLLLTDVASGWIPPNIEIPTGVTLLPPAERRGDLTALLGPTTRTALHLPGQYLPPNQPANPVAMSIRSRDVTNLDDLGWELAQATKWRDGLPRLAHTLAKAVTAQTGWLDSEASLLRDHLCTVAQSVIAAYPEHIDSDRIANWQLLATIDALISNQQTLANYHFAWFRAHTLTREARP